MVSARDRRWQRTWPWLMLSLLGAALSADDVRPLEGKQKARVSVSLLGSAPEGATRPAMVLGPVDVAVGEQLPLPPSFAVGGTDPRGCAARMTFDAPATLLGTYALVWTANVEVLSVSIDRIELAATWERQTRGEDGQPERLAGESGARLTLREGDRALLDFADRAPRGEPLCARNFALELKAEVAEDPALAARPIGYEIWLVHQAPGGKKLNRHLEMSATQGRESPFHFPGERLPVLAGASPDEPATELQVDVKGTVRGRTRPDGSLDLSLGTERTLWYVSAGEHVGDGGQKILHVQPGETIRVELPGATHNTQRPERYARDLAGHSFALILTAKPLS